VDGGWKSTGAAAALALVALLAAAETAAAAGLDALVAEGLAASHTLRAERATLVRRDAAVREATGRFLPSLALSGRISDRSGDVLDLGRLVNPAYAALDQLTGTRAFPTNLDLKLPMREEAVLRLTQPLFDVRLPANRSVQAGLRDAQRGITGAATRRFVADVRTGYLDYARATRLTQLYDSTLVLVDEMVRVQESLLAHGSATPDEVLRVRAERSDVAQRRGEAARLADAARQSFNVRIGRAVDAPLPLLADDELGIPAPPPLEAALVSAAARREELAAARGGLRAARGELALAHAGYVPSVAAAVDWGVQGENVHLGRGEDYRVASLVASWSLFDGGQREARRREAIADVDAAGERAADAVAQVELDARTAWQAAEVSRLARVTAADRLAAARRTWEMVSRRHANGAATLLELLDARTSFTSAGLNAVMTDHEYLQRCAELDRAAALDNGRPRAGEAGR
jgi:outer membrane protein TolC